MLDLSKKEILPSMSLNKDQKAALSYLIDWWSSPTMYAVIDASGGVGKTYLVDALLKKLPNCEPLILAPTHQALLQIKNKTEGDYLYKTVHSALGITPTTTQKDLEFKHARLPSLWENYNFVVMEEASMLSDFLLDLLISTGVKILFIGDHKQLPSVDTNRKRDDKCLSPVFLKGWETLTLTIPQRHTGALWDFNNIVGQATDDFSVKIPKDYNITSKKLQELLKGDESKANFLSGSSRLALWKNSTIDFYNEKIRLMLFSEDALSSAYLPLDNLILTEPLTVIDKLHEHSDYAIKRLLPLREELTYLYSNTEAVVKKVEIIEVKLNKDLVFNCYKLDVLVAEDFHTLYSIVDQEDYLKLKRYYEVQAWNAPTPKAKSKKYREMHFILSCFASIKHSYAMSAHRLQGASIPNVIVIKSDIMKNPCKAERAKVFYVACSRAIDNLYIYNGG